MNIKEKINILKKDKNAIILAHYYQPEKIQEVADFVGDSYYLSKIAKESEKKIIVFCGVRFMAESAKILSPEKKVLIPDNNAGCIMADMMEAEELINLKKKYKDVAVVTYINSSTEVKAVSDVIVTSSNAKDIVGKLKEKNIIFSPDKNLGAYIKDKLPEKNIILWEGFCPIHENISVNEIIDFKEKFSEGIVLAHLECNKAIREIATYIGSTSGMLERAKKYKDKDILIITEEGIFYQLNKHNDGNNRFYKTKSTMLCENMKKITLEKVYQCLLNENDEVEIEENLRLKAFKSLDNMHKLGS